MKILANVEVRLNGKVVARGHNLVVNTGLALLASIISPAGATKPSHMGIGGNSTAPTETDVALLSEFGVARQAIAGSVSSTVITYTVAFPIAFFIGIGEVGIFNASSGGVMLARFTFPTLVVNNGDTLNITWQLEVSG